MSQYLFIVSDRLDSDGNKVSGREVFDFLMEKRAWGLHPTTQHRAVLQDGDQIIFYLAGPNGGFLGSAVLASSAYLDKSGESDKWWFNRSEVNYRVDLRDVDKWDRVKPIQPLLQNLGFIKKTKNWGVYLQGGVRKITLDDRKTILESEIYEAEIPKEKSVSETMISFNPDAAAYQPHSLRSPERVKINRIVENVERGWQIPNFQRYFDWNKEQVRSLLESIFNDYYVGSFLVWEAGRNSNLVIEPIKGITRTHAPDHIILDGQQRMTAIYYAMKALDFPLRGSGKRKSYFYLDLRAFLEDGSREDIVVIRDKKLSRKESFDSLLFPFYELEKLHEWVYGFEEFLEKETDDKAQVRNITRTIETRLRHMWDGFEIPYIVLPETMDLVHVADIFEKINSTGKPLSTFDLLIARLLKYKIELKSLWDKACENYQNISRYSENEKTRMAVFQTMSLLYHPTSSCKRKDILNVYDSLSISDKTQFESYWKTCIEAIDNAISRLENMRDGFGVRSEKDVPFMPAIPMLAALLVRMESAENKSDAYGKIHQWYWSSCITAAYSSSAESQMTSDFKEVTRWFDEDDVVPSVVAEARTQLSIMSFLDTDESSSAAYQAVLSLVALTGARDFVTGSNLENARGNQKDHIFPKSPTVGFGRHKKIDSVLNMTWMSDQTNMFIKRAKKPSEYAPQFVAQHFGGDGEKFVECVKTHLIDDVAFDAMKTDDIDGFFEARQSWIKKVFSERIGGMNPVESKLDKDASGFIDRIEENIRLLIDSTLTAKKSDYWDLVPQGVREGITERISQHERKNPADSGKKWTLGEKLSFCNIMDYYSIMSTKANWAEFEKRFGSRTEAEKHFSQFNEYRNCVKHKRSMNNITRKLGEASLEWLESVLGKSHK